jgi:hypothetical protein
MHPRSRYLALLSARCGRALARRAFLGSVGELIVIVRQLEHQGSGFKVFYFDAPCLAVNPVGTVSAIPSSQFAASGISQQ